MTQRATTLHHAEDEVIKDAGQLYASGDVEGALQETANSIATHQGLPTNAHEAYAISIADAGSLYTGTSVEAALQEAFLTAKSGWFPKEETWTRTGNHTFTLSGDYSADPDYLPGVFVRYKDGGSFEYGVILSNSHSGGTTTINLIPNTDYAMAAATITSKAISKSSAPDGFPAAFNYTATSSAAGTGTPTFTITTTDTTLWQPAGKRKIRIVIALIGTTGGSTITALRATLPMTISGGQLQVPTANYSTGVLTARVGSGSATTTDAQVRSFDTSDIGIGTNRIFRWDGIVEI